MKRVPLTRKQVYIMEKLCSGKTIGQIADGSGMSESTVSTHLRRVKQKLGGITTAHVCVLYTTFKREETTTTRIEVMVPAVDSAPAAAAATRGDGEP